MANPDHARRKTIALPPALPAPERMTLVDRIAVDADRRAIAAMDDPVERIVTCGAKGPERAENKGVVIATMCREMVRHRRRRDLASIEAEAAKRLGLQLMRATVLP